MSADREERAEVVLADSVERERTSAAVMSRLFGDEGGKVLAGRFRLIELLGVGSMGSVYLAEDTELGRHVAVKRLSSVARGERDEELAERRRERMLREARALAKVSHRNVVAVHDVHAQGQEVFVAMEFVPGQNIRRWLADGPPLDAILGVFTQAATGLAAAHASGLVHRDFKPANAVVGADGRVRVVDFGLAATGREDSEPDAAPGEPLPVSGSRARLTATGAIVGTPSYMAPEQLAGGAADARSDQFALCVSLWEAVVGERPFDGANERELLEAIGRGPRPAPAGKLPRWLARVLERGLQPDPAARYDGMAPIIRAIDPAIRRRSRRRRRVAVGGVATVLLVAAVARATAPEVTASEDPCPDRPLPEETWSEARAQSIASRIGSVIDAEYADELASAAVARLDAYAADWADARRDACVDAYVDRVHSEALFDLRMRCLQRRASTLDALLGRLAVADAELASRMPATVAKLPDLEECADGARLDAAYARPDGADSTRVEEIESLADQADAAIIAGAHDEARTHLDTARARLEGLAWPVMDAQLGLSWGQLLAADEDIEGAERSLLDAAAAAEGAGADHIVARAWLVLVWHASTKAKDAERAEFYLERARAAVTRVGEPPRLLARLRQRRATHAMTRGRYDEAVQILSVAGASLDDERDAVTLGSMEMDLGRAYYSQGKYEDAVQRFEAARRRFEGVYGVGHPRVASVLSNQGSAELMAGRRGDAYGHLREAYEAQRSVYGDDHPRVARTLNSLASVDYMEGRFDDALRQYREVLRIVEAAKGDGHADLADPLSNIGRTLARLGRFEEALEPSIRGLEIIEAGKGPEHPDVATALTGLGGVQASAAQLPAALASHRRALAIREAAFGSDSAKAAESGVTVADIYRRLDQPERALQTVQRWLPIMREKLGGAHPHTAPAEVTLGWLLMDAGDASEAAAAFRRAEEGLADDTPATRVMLDLGLGMTTWTEAPAAARVRLQRVVEAGEDTRFAELAERAQKFLEARDSAPVP